MNKSQAGWHLLRYVIANISPPIVFLFDLLYKKTSSTKEEG